MKKGSLGSKRRSVYRPLNKISVALKGIRYAVVLDLAVAYKLVVSVLLLIWCFYFRQWMDLSVILLATGMMLMAEIFNTVIEALCDFIEPNEHSKIGMIKDMAAGAVGISIGVWVVVICVEFYRAWRLLVSL